MIKGGQGDQLLTVQQSTGSTGPPKDNSKQQTSQLHPSEILDNRTKRRQQIKADTKESIPEQIEIGRPSLEE